MAKRIDTFADYAIKMDALVFSDIDAIVNDAAQYQVYTFFEAFKRRRNIKAGKFLKDYIELAYTSTAEWLAAGHIFGDLQIEDGSVEHSCRWGDLWNRIVWYDDETEDEGETDVMWKSIYEGKRLRKAQDTYDKLETSLWADANERMEIPVGSTVIDPKISVLPYSIPALLTRTNAATPQLSPFAAGTVMQVNATTFPAWRNQHADLADFNAEIEDAIFDMYYLSQWKTAGGPADKYMTGTPVDGCVVYADLKSIKKTRKVLLNRNDTLARIGARDTSVQVGPWMLSWAVPLGKQDIADTAQRMYGVHWDFLIPTVKKGRFLKLVKSKHGGSFEFPNQPTGNALYERTTENLWMRSRKRHFMIGVAA